MIKSSSFIFFSSFWLVVAFPRFFKSYAFPIQYEEKERITGSKKKDENIFVQTHSFSMEWKISFLSNFPLSRRRRQTRDVKINWQISRSAEPHRMFAIDGERNFSFTFHPQVMMRIRNILKRCYINNSFSTQIISHTLLSTRVEFLRKTRFVNEFFFLHVRGGQTISGPCLHNTWGFSAS